MLDIVLALNGIADVLEPLEIDQSFPSVLLCEAVDESRAMLEYPADEDRLSRRHTECRSDGWSEYKRTHLPC